MRISTLIWFLKAGLKKFKMVFEGTLRLALFLQFTTIVICSLTCLSTLIAYIANNMDPDQTTPRSSLIRVRSVCFCLFFVALRPKSTAMVMAGWSVHLTTIFSWQA